jgi:hypothetical protein
MHIILFYFHLVITIICFISPQTFQKLRTRTSISHLPRMFYRQSSFPLRLLNNAFSTTWVMKHELNTKSDLVRLQNERCDQFSNTVPEFTWRNWEKPRNPSNTLASLSIDIQRRENKVGVLTAVLRRLTAVCETPVPTATELGLITCPEGSLTRLTRSSLNDQTSSYLKHS